MKIFYHLNGTERKPLVKAIEDITGEKAKYMKVPTCAYRIGCYSVEKDGTLAADDSVSTEQFDEQAKRLAENGFEGEKGYMSEQAEEEALDTREKEPAEEETLDTREEKLAEEETQDADEEEPTEEKPQEISEEEHSEEEADEGSNTIDSLTVSLPKDGFDERSLSNLRNFLTAKGNLIKKAMEIDDLPVELSAERVFFPWFHHTLTYDEVQAYTLFIVNLCALAKKTSRISALEKPVENQKYAWRCTLLRLDFIGDGSKLYRKILMRNFSGESGAFKCGHKHSEEATNNEDAE